MMEAIRNFFQHNLMYKVASLLLAIIIWAMINDAISEAPGGVATLPEERRVVDGVPVLVLGRAAEQAEVTVKPPEVRVTVKGPPHQVRFLLSSQLNVYVDVSALNGPGRFRQRVQYSVNAWGVQVDSISPREVEVEIK